MELDATLNANEMFIHEWGSVASFTQDDIDSMRTSAYYSTRLAPGLITVSWNTNYMYITLCPIFQKPFKYCRNCLLMTNTMLIA